MARDDPLPHVSHEPPDLGVSRRVRCRLRGLTPGDGAGDEVRPLGKRLLRPAAGRGLGQLVAVRRRPQRAAQQQDDVGLPLPPSGPLGQVVPRGDVRADGRDELLARDGRQQLRRWRTEQRDASLAHDVPVDDPPLVGTAPVERLARTDAHDLATLRRSVQRGHRRVGHLDAPFPGRESQRQRIVHGLERGEVFTAHVRRQRCHQVDVAQPGVEVPHDVRPPQVQPQQLRTDRLANPRRQLFQQRLHLFHHVATPSSSPCAAARAALAS